MHFAGFLEIFRQALVVLLLMGQVILVWREIKRTTAKGLQGPR